MGVTERRNHFLSRPAWEGYSIVNLSFFPPNTDTIFLHNRTDLSFSAECFFSILR